MPDNLPAVYDVQSIETMARYVAQSRLFGLDPAQAFTLMLLAQSKGLHPIQAVERYHVIQGRPAMKADAMLAEFQARGGTVRWVIDTDTECEAVFTHSVHAPEGNTARYTLADAKRADLLKNPTWAKYPANMLRARVISNGVRKTLPGVVSGIYTPEEVQDFDEPRETRRPTATLIPVEPPASVPGEKLNGKGRDARPYYELAKAGVEASNQEFRDEFPGAEDVLNVFQLDKHMVKAAVAEGLMPDPGKRVKAIELSKQLTMLYQTPEGRPWVRREMSEYLASKLREARAAAALEDASDGEVFEDVDSGGEVTVEELRSEGREPGQEG